jgi:hypothetical protein
MPGRRDDSALSPPRGHRAVFQGGNGAGPARAPARDRRGRSSSDERRCPPVVVGVAHRDEACSMPVHNSNMRQRADREPWWREGLMRGVRLDGGARRGSPSPVGPARRLFRPRLRACAGRVWRPLAPRRPRGLAQVGAICQPGEERVRGRGSAQARDPVPRPAEGCLDRTLGTLVGGGFPSRSGAELVQRVAVDRQEHPSLA